MDGRVFRMEKYEPTAEDTWNFEATGRPLMVALDLSLDGCAVPKDTSDPIDDEYADTDRYSTNPNSPSYAYQVRALDFDAVPARPSRASAVHNALNSAASRFLQWQRRDFHHSP